MKKERKSLDYRSNPCFTCAGGVDCDDCINSPKNSVLVKLYTPKGAARAMLVGKILKDCDGRTYWWGDSTFYCQDKNKAQPPFPVRSFSGLFSEDA